MSKEWLQWYYREITVTVDEAIIKPNRVTLENALNEQGENGWELVSILQTELDDSKYRFRCIFKQPKAELGTYEYD